jgi:AraC-like DNA-binding protein
MKASGPIQDQLHTIYGTTINRALEALTLGRMPLRIPRPGAQYKRWPRSHFHPTSEIFFQTGGATDFECDQDRFRLATHQLCLMPRGTAHAETPVNLRTPYSILVFMHAADGFYINRARSPDGRRIVAHSVDHRLSPRGRDAFYYLDEIARHESIAKSHRKTYVEGLLKAFLVTMLDEIGRPVSQVCRTFLPKIVEAEKLVRAHLGNPDMSVSSLATSLGCSADYLSRVFRNERQVTLNRWIVNERIAMARELLRDHRYNISEVGWACGFNSPSYFVRVFREHTNLTPLAFRK